MSVRIRILSDLDAKGLKEAQSGLEKLKDINDKVFRAVAASAGLAAVGIAKFAGDSIKAASNLAESTNAVNVAFGKSAKAVLAIGENSAEALGLAQNEFNQAAVRFSAFAERIVGVGNDTSGFIEDITQRAADFASVFNIEVAEALQVFQSGLAGEAEPLKRFGINLLDSEVKAYALANGIIEVGEQMTETEKVQARYGLLLESTAKTAGDFANTSDGLANSQRILKAQFTDLQAEIGGALLPAFTELFKTVADQVMPELEKLGEFLKSPEGQKAISDLANTVADLTTRFIENIPTIINAAAQLAAFTIAVKVVTTAIQLATTAKLLFNTAMAFPLTSMVLGIGAATIAFQGLHLELKRNREAATGLTGRTAEINAEFVRLRELVDSGVISFKDYTAQIQPLVVELSRLEGQFGATTGEANRFNNLKLNNARAEMSATAELGAKLANQQRQLYFAMRGLDPSKGLFDQAPATTEIASSVVSSGPSAFEQAREKVQDLIRSSQKQLADAQKTFVRAQADARQTYADNILRIEADFSSRLSGIIQQSQDRLRSAYKSAVETNLVALFDQQEEKSVEGLVQSLSDRLAGSRRLLENSAQLASQGFSQTFIEQVVSAGVETGNELASAILESTPETQAELRSLFSAIESEASSGMDSLANEIFEKQGFATQELKVLYETTQGELAQALLEQQTLLDSSLTAANDAFIESVTNIKSALAEQLSDMEGQFGGMERTIDQFMGKLDQLIAKYGQVKAAQTMAEFMPEPTGGTGTAISFLPMPTPVTNRPVSQPAPQININVKTDTTQSNAMVGKAIAKEVNKYTGGGGGLRGIKVVAI